MSDVQQGPEWWLGTDGKWYPPGAAAPPPPEVEDQRPVPPVVDDGEPTVAGAPRRRTWVVLAVIASALIVLGVGVAAALTAMSSSPTKYAIGGTMLLRDLSSGSEGKSCGGSGGYSDIRSGANVVVSGGDGKTLATGELGAGRQVYPTSSRTGSYFNCEFPILMSATVPKSDFYKVEVSHRGQLTYSFDDMKQQNWTVSLTLGR